MKLKPSHDRPLYYQHKNWGGLWELTFTDTCFFARVIFKPVTWDGMVLHGWEVENCLDLEDRNTFVKRQIDIKQTLIRRLSMCQWWHQLCEAEDE